MAKNLDRLIFVAFHERGNRFKLYCRFYTSRRTRSYNRYTLAVETLSASRSTEFTAGRKSANRLFDR